MRYPIVEPEHYCGAKKALIRGAGTKYFATSRLIGLKLGLLRLFCVSDIFALMIPSRHCRCSSKTPEPELPVVADEQPREDPLEQWFSKEAIAEVRAWRRGGPVPTSAAGLELMEVYVRVDEDV